MAYHYADNESMKRNRGVVLICPACQAELLRKDSAYYCKACNQQYPIKDDVDCFLNEDDDFIENLSHLINPKKNNFHSILSWLLC